MTKSTLISRSEFLAQAGTALLGLLAGAEQLKAAAVDDKTTKSGAKKRYTMVVLTNAKAGKDAEFNEWYTHRHIPDVLKTPGFTSAQRFKLAIPPSPTATGPSWHYYSAYQLDTADPKATVDELVKRYGTDQMPLGDSMDPSSFFFAVYEAVTPVISK